MKVIDALKINKYKNVSVPRNKDLYARVGGRIPSQGTRGFVSDYGKDKMTVLAEADSALMAEYEQSTQAQK